MAKHFGTPNITKHLVNVCKRHLIRVWLKQPFGQSSVLSS